MFKVLARYLARLALIYCRQSTPEQVRRNEGSRQYQGEQREVARRHGWRPDMIRVIDRDLGMSGMRDDRPGYLELKELIRTGQVGALFISDVSRAGREERAWFDLLDLLIEHDVLLFKNGVMTDPQDESQAFVTKIEAVIVRRENQMRLANMHRGRLAKARMGKAVSAPSIGFVPVYETQDGEPRKTGAWDMDPNLEVREAIHAVFAAFREGRSLRKAVDLLNARGVKIPARRGRPSKRRKGALKSEPSTTLRWEEPTVPNVRRFIRHPAYAGAYVYGTRHWRRVRGGGDPVPESRLIGQFVERWDHHEGYITPDEFRENQEILALNAKRAKRPHLGPGPALLQGRCVCARHGAMAIHYHHRVGSRGWSFRCLGDYLVGGKQCVSVAGLGLEQAVVSTVLRAIDVPVIDEVRTLWRTEKGTWARRHRGLEQELDRRRASLDRVKQRLLEQEGGARPRLRAMLEEEYERVAASVEELGRRVAKEEVEPDPFTEEGWDELRSLCERIEDIWSAPTTTDQDRKQLVRLVIDAVVIEEVNREGVKLRVDWADGRPATHLELLLSPYFHRLMAEWQQAGLSAREMVVKLKELGARTQQGNPWSLATVQRTLNVMKETKNRCGEGSQ